VAFFYAATSIAEYFRLESEYRAGNIPWQEYLYAAQYFNIILLFVLVYLGLYVVPFIVALPAAAGIVLLWQDPPRILVLRPFNRRPLTRGLARLVHRDVARYGHVSTLADAELRVPWYVRVPVFFGQLALLSFRARIIRKERQLARLERALRRTWLRNINWCLSWRKVFAVATDDMHWQRVVERLVREATVILIDLTEARPNVLWEVALIDRLGERSRVIWLLRHGDAVPELGEEQRARLQTLIYSYDESGSRDGEGLRMAIARRVTEDRRARQRWVRRGRTVSIIALAMFVVGCLPLLSLWLETIGELMERTDIGEMNVVLLIVGFGLATWLMLAAAAIRNRNAWFFVVVQFVLLTGGILING
ncbi:MAG: hypothetical protein ACRD2A_17445, partial [Vicinamibacterales bacterium]